MYSFFTLIKDIPLCFQHSR